MLPGSDGPATPYDDPELPFTTTTQPADTTTTTASDDSSSGLSTGAIIGIVIGVLVLLALLGVGIWWVWFRMDGGAPRSSNSGSNNRAYGANRHQ
jgi:hypothetical protein